ncbi:hypothetical protein ACFVTF_10425 [Kitasatospora sp. NPDC057940]|uniref:hypothetical protein n=1 Tax=Kitasatospora sp. NPDC057940 TaxID=3346285 RepID=UPI0036DC26B0
MNTTRTARTPATPALNGCRTSRRRLRARIGLAATATALSLLPIAPSTASAAPHLPLTQIVREAKVKAQQEHPGSQFYDADAVLLAPTTNPNDVQAWWIRFRAKGSEPSFEYKYSTTGQYQSTQPWSVPIGIQAISSFTMTEVQAHDLAVKAGHTGAFKPLYLNEPVVQNPHPTYYFCIPSEGRTVAVDTATGHVTTPWPC